MKPRSILTACLVLALVAVFTPKSFTQATISFAQVNGTVLDEGGRAIVKAAVNLREIDTNQSYTATTNDAGFYVVPSLPPGKYEMAVAYTGFAKYTQTGIVLSVGETATYNVELEVAAGGEVIRVRTGAPTVEAGGRGTRHVVE